MGQLCANIWVSVLGVREQGRPGMAKSASKSDPWGQGAGRIMGRGDEGSPFRWGDTGSCHVAPPPGPSPGL